jgi:hypothetical protein
MEPNAMKISTLAKTTAALAAALLTTTAAQAGEVYALGGFPGLILGYSHSVTPAFGVRADVGGLPSIDEDGTEEGIDYTGKAKILRTGLFGDWYAFGGGFRLTAGVTLNNTKVDLSGRGNGGTIDIGGTTYAVGPNDRFDVRIKLPSSTPYVGLGWGHNASTAGWNFVFDFGVSIGKAKVSASTNIPGVTQDDIDRELEELRDGVGKVRVIPQVTLGVGYRF